ncbi:MAG: ATP-binding protein [Prevotellaceae bacterium]|nr:ATP-binding protein [Prevotellaceae bacterium]
MTDKIKQIPYAIADFPRLRRDNCYYVDKTMYLEKLERYAHFLFLVRPRRFGKSLFVSMLESYYDLAQKGDFDRLFGNLYVGQHPTGEQNQYQVVRFDFSKTNTGGGSLEENFIRYCGSVLDDFMFKYGGFYDEDTKRRYSEADAATKLNILDPYARCMGYRLYLIIDEYDNFTNDVLNSQGEGKCHALTHADGFYCNFFKLFKGMFARIMMIGVSPITLDDLTSGYNIGTNLTTDSMFNCMLGFSEMEVRDMVEYYRSAGQIRQTADELIDLMKPWYDNYCFSQRSFGHDPKMFNSDMVLYFLNVLVTTGHLPETMLDNNSRTDYDKMKRIVELDKNTDHRLSLIRKIAEEGTITFQLKDTFPAETITKEDNFLSLLFYYGMLSVVDVKRSSSVYGIPNNNIRRQYYDYMLENYQRHSGLNLYDLNGMYEQMAYDGQWRPALDHIAEAYGRNSSVRSQMEGERNVQGFLTAYFSVCRFYLTYPEAEIAHGYADIFLLPDFRNYPEVSHSYIFELKYAKADATEGEVAAQREEAERQLRQYATDAKVRQLQGNSTLHLVCLQFRGWQKLAFEEVDAVD